MKGFTIIICLALSGTTVFSQDTDTVSVSEISRIMHVLASDSLKGRGNYTPELYKAAYFIASEFSNDSLKPFPGFSSLIAPFSIGKLKSKWRDANGKYDPNKVLFNVVAMLEGKTLPSEIVIFSAHYDHVGMRNEKKKGDHIFNGANDNASGTAALLALAHYYAQKNDNNRTLLFCAFGGEELGVLGSSVYAHFLKKYNIVTVINIEMIGRYNVGGKNSFFITGSEYSNLDDIMQKNLEGYNMKIVEEPSTELQLFQRSDNIPFALNGIPAHTIMCSDDRDECYHKECDEIERIDMDHMAAVIRSIIVATNTLVNGEDRPSRITRKIEPLYPIVH